MISLSEVGGLYLSTPANIKDARTKAFMYACDRQIKKLLERAEKIKVWCAIESVDEKYLDYMAADCRALFYNSSLAPDVKRKLIANSQYWYMKLGTSAAMEEMINIVFQNSDTSVEEWFSYGGNPFHFRVAVGKTVSKESIEEFLYYLSKVKNARSIFDYLSFRKNEKAFLHANIANGIFIRIGRGISSYSKSVYKVSNINVSSFSLVHVCIFYHKKEEQ